MANDTVILIGVDEVRNLLQGFPKHLFDKAKKEVSRSVFNVQKAIVSPMKTGANDLQSRTGNLARSIKTRVIGTSLKTLSGKVDTESIYAPIHEIGGTITAKKAYSNLQGGPFLNIPSSQNKTAAGVMRKSATVVFSEGGYIIPINAPKARYAVMLGGIPMFWLVKSVYIKARLKMMKSASDEVPTLLSNINNILLEGL